MQDTIPIHAAHMSQKVAVGALAAGKPWLDAQMQALRSNRWRPAGSPSCTTMLPDGADAVGHVDNGKCCRAPLPYTAHLEQIFLVYIGAGASGAATSGDVKGAGMGGYLANCAGRH